VAFDHSLSRVPVPAAPALADRPSREATARVAARFFSVGGVRDRMESVRKGIRAGDLEKDVYERLACAECEEQLGTKNDPDELGTVRVCPGCGREWRRVG
jgi:hypothetical protein